MRSSAVTSAAVPWLAAALLLAGCTRSQDADFKACVEMVGAGFRPVAAERSQRFLGKVKPDTARCRGGEQAVRFNREPWVDWQSYWAAEDAASRAPGGNHFGEPNGRGNRGALLDLRDQRMDLIK